MTEAPERFASVVACTACPLGGSLLRDSGENVPQPGFVGRRYWEHRVLLVGQNPGVPPPHMQARDAVYTAALRRVRDERSEEAYEELARVLRGFVPEWPVHGSYFPLAECGLELDDIAYCNVVRCRTMANKPPSEQVSARCAQVHFGTWLDWLEPRVVVFIGKWGFERAGHLPRSRGVQTAYMNRLRSLSSAERAANRAEVVGTVRRAREATGP